MKIYYVSLYPTPGYMRHFIVAAESPIAAINKINKFARDAYKIHMESNPKDPHQNAQRAKHIITATRRYFRKHKPRWAGREPQSVCTVKEISLNVPWEGHLNMCCMDSAYAWNILPNLPLTASSQEAAGKE